jgi:hypothetical protein
LLCQTIVKGDVIIDPASERRVVRDLVCDRGKKQQ